MPEKMPKLPEIDMRTHEDISEHEEQVERERRSTTEMDEEAYYEVDGQSTKAYQDTDPYGESTISEGTPEDVKEKILGLMRKAEETELPDYQGGGVYHTDQTVQKVSNTESDMEDKDMQYPYGYGGKTETPKSVWRQFKRFLAKKNPDAHEVIMRSYSLNDPETKASLSHRNKVTGTLFEEYMQSSPDRKDKLDQKKVRSFLDEQNMN